MMQSMRVLCLFAAFGYSTALRRFRKPSLIEFGQENSTAAVAKTMVDVEHRWLNWALQSVGCSVEDSTSFVSNATANATDARSAFNQSCNTVSKLLVRTNGGEKTKLQAFMGALCGQDELKGQPEELCLDYSQWLSRAMSDDFESTESSLDVSKVCTGLFETGYLSSYASQEVARRKQIADARAAEQQRKADEAAAAEAKAKQEKEAAEARRHLEEVANATKVADRKREEAVKAAVEAQRKADEVQRMETVQHRLEEEAKAAAEEARVMKRNVSSQVAKKNASSSSSASSA